jgi:lysozyme family protein
MTFDEALARLLEHEGGFSHHPADPGGATRYGVTEAVARAAGYTGEMQALPLEVARQIYRRLYWDAVRAEELPAELRNVLFDAAVNSGAKQSIRWLQRAIGVADDGVIGPQTLTAMRKADAVQLKARLLAQRLRFMTQLPTWQAFSRGWSRRIAELMEA